MVGSAFKGLDTGHDFTLVGSSEYDLRITSQVDDMIYHHEPDAIIHLAAKVGGVKGNTDFVADFFYENIMIKCKDFVPEIIKKGGFFTVAKAQEFQACLDQANEWISNYQIEVINIETVVLPNIHDELEEGSMDTNLDTLGDTSSSWNQFIRIWFREN